MNWLRFLRRKRSDAELRDEIEAFLAEETADNVARGMSPDEARRRARVKLGNAQQVREALWAQRDQLLRLMLRDGLRPALLGLGLGLVASIAATRIFQSMLFGTRPLDPMVLSSVMATLLAVAVLACLAPAWRASRLDPMQALRSE